MLHPKVGTTKVKPAREARLGWAEQRTVGCKGNRRGYRGRGHSSASIQPPPPRTASSPWPEDSKLCSQPDPQGPKDYEKGTGRGSRHGKGRKVDTCGWAQAWGWVAPGVTTRKDQRSTVFRVAGQLAACRREQSVRGGGLPRPLHSSLIACRGPEGCITEQLGTACLFLWLLLDNIRQCNSSQTQGSKAKPSQLQLLIRPKLLPSILGRNEGLRRVLPSKGFSVLDSFLCFALTHGAAWQLLHRVLRGRHVSVSL